jgi:hypothetical protein
MLKTAGIGAVLIAIIAVGVWWWFFTEVARIATDPAFRQERGAIVEGFPTDFPTYPESELVGSALANRPDQPTAGYRVKWKSDDDVAAIMQWFARELPKNGWTFEPPTDNSPGEQIGKLRKGMLEGYVAAEVEEPGETEIVVDLKIQ